MPKLPNLLLIGMSKSSTTTLYHLLGQHPEVFTPEQKGIYYFSDKYDDSGAWEWYQKFFEKVDDSKKIICEASNSYTHQPFCGDVPNRIKEKLGEPKMILMMRDPVKRLVSNYRHLSMAVGPSYADSFAEALDKHPRLLATSRFAYQIGFYEDVFGPDFIKYFLAEELHKDHVDVMRQVETYLDISEFPWSKDHLPAANTYTGLRHMFGWKKLLGDRLFNIARKYTPGPLRRKMKGMAPKVPAPPEPTEADLERVFDEIRDDLEKMVDRFGDRLDVWSSVQKLKNEKKTPDPIPAAS